MSKIKQRKIYLSDEDYNKFIAKGGVKTLESMLHNGDFKLNIETDEDGFPIYTQKTPRN